jgi:hypothetical protein
MVGLTGIGVAVSTCWRHGGNSAATPGKVAHNPFSTLREDGTVSLQAPG